MNLIAEIAHEWLGTPFHYHQSLKGVGCDCVGLIVGVLKEAEVLEQDFKLEHYGYSSGISENNLAMLEKISHKVEILEMAPGDILIFSLPNSPVHFGILLELHPHPTFIHSHVSVRKVMIHNLDERWIRRIKSCYRPTTPQPQSPYS